ncbi:Uncharacterised protein [Mycobacteroides abscessus subsp. abscessus]|nr:Uncharacterised protein [Mycobacteroides abscessus subsp. abscessus]
MDVAGRTIDDQTRPRVRTGHLLAQTCVTADPGDATRLGDVLADGLVLLRFCLRLSHGHLPVFPTLRRICSPS